MALPHAASGQLINVRPLGERLAGANSVALVKGRDLEIMHLVVHPGRPFPAHQVAGEVTILCLEGQVELTAHGQVQTMQAGDLVYLRGGESHALQADAFAAVLVTIALKNSSQ